VQGANAHRERTSPGRRRSPPSGRPASQSVRQRWGLPEGQTWTSIPDVVEDILVARGVTPFQERVFFRVIRAWRWDGAVEQAISETKLAGEVRSQRRHVRAALLGLADKGILSFFSMGQGKRPNVSIRPVIRLIHRPEAWRSPSGKHVRRRTRSPSDPGPGHMSEQGTGGLSVGGLDSARPESPEKNQKGDGVAAPCAPGARAAPPESSRPAARVRARMTPDEIAAHARRQRETAARWEREEAEARAAAAPAGIPDTTADASTVAHEGPDARTE